MMSHFSFALLMTVMAALMFAMPVHKEWLDIIVATNTGFAWGKAWQHYMEGAAS